MRRAARLPKVNRVFAQVMGMKLQRQGWKLYMKPLLPCIDDEWIFRHRDDRLDFLFVCESDRQWSRKRFVREPFGDYTTVYQNKGEGKDGVSLMKNLEQDQQKAGKQ